jgi:4-hydroxy-tetrahydrodipicolinate synthase
VVEIGVETVARLAEACPNIVGIKESGGTPERVSLLKAALPDRFSIVSGDDSMTLPFLSVGAVGVISVASNLLPGEIVRMVRAWEDGRADVAREIHARHYPLFKALFIETSPVPIKTALSYVGLTRADCRLPLCEMSEANAAVLRSVMSDLGLIKP